MIHDMTHLDSSPARNPWESTTENRQENRRSEGKKEIRQDEVIVM